VVKATRWQELGADVTSLAKLALALPTRLDLRLLNPTSGLQCISLGHSEAASYIPRAVLPPGGLGLGGLGEVERMVSTSPTGSTPLTEAVQVGNRREAKRARPPYVTNQKLTPPYLTPLCVPPSCRR